MASDAMRDSTENSQVGRSGTVIALRPAQVEERLMPRRDLDSKKELTPGGAYAVKRIACFFGMITVLVFGLHMMITAGLRHVKTGQYGVSNRMMLGKINAKVIITGSSRALSHFDPRIIEAQTGLTAFNLGRNGAQADMELA